ncbi:uncharacterized protein LOC111699517 isoform X4 [Eurytemora carolleeae]|nr:uncharacterized protein LOC111699517 isoform X4 [Eurytemora carolleeae]XP_023325977.1 uncharacterized protein LOC111699517 isoform X4 [Eurytemora carolleeae]|eukprot:XP_023325976.1 uncharacterized protein LOC111699517 isoform X4 [Eurytemora affinis]
MNSSFTAYLFSDKPKITTEKKSVSIKKRMVIEDDMKKYWGFYLLRGSTVRLGGCARWPGSSVVVVQGSEDARRCAWLGELDSTEESDEFSNEDEDINDQDDDFVNYVQESVTAEVPLDTLELSPKEELSPISKLVKAVRNLPEDERKIFFREFLYGIEHVSTHGNLSNNRARESLEKLFNR